MHAYELTAAITVGCLAVAVAMLAAVAGLVAGCGWAGAHGGQPAGDHRRQTAPSPAGGLVHPAPQGGRALDAPSACTGRRPAWAPGSGAAGGHAPRRLRRAPPTPSRTTAGISRPTPTGFVVAYPDGGEPRLERRAAAAAARPAATTSTTWPSSPRWSTPSSHEVPIDPARVYATGISNGGLMAYRLACDTDRLRRHRPRLGHADGHVRPSPHPVSVIHIHGLSDDRIPFTGGKGTGFATVVDGPPVPTVMAMWRSVDGCPRRPHHGRGGDHVGGHLPVRARRRADHHHRRRAPVAGRQGAPG